MRTGGTAALSEADVDRAVFHLDRVGAQVHQHRGAERLAAGVVEPAVVLGALDDAALDQAVAQQRLLVGAVAVGGVVGVLGGPVERVVLAGVLERDDVLGVDLVRRAGGDPLGHEAGAPCQATAASASGRARPSVAGVGSLNGAAPGSSWRRT